MKSLMKSPWSDSATTSDLSDTISTVRLKLRFNGEYRRISLEKRNLEFDQLRSILFEIFAVNKETHDLNISYQDEEGDSIKITSNQELVEAISLTAPNSLLHLNLTSGKFRQNFFSFTEIQNSPEVEQPTEHSHEILPLLGIPPENFGGNTSNGKKWTCMVILLLLLVFKMWWLLLGSIIILFHRDYFSGILKSGADWLKNKNESNSQQSLYQTDEFKRNLTILENMGWNDRKKNITLLYEFNGDINKAIDKLTE